MHLFLFILIDVFPHLVLVKPNWIGISSNEFISIHTLDCEGSLDPLLLTIHEDGHELLLSLLLSGFLLWCKFLLSPCHLLVCC